MDKVSIAIGVLLLALGIYAYSASEVHAPTALIPAVVGGILAICGVVVAARPATRKHVMHLAATVALLGFLAAAGKLLTSLARGAHLSQLSRFSLLAMIVLTLLFLALAIRSFINARRSRPATGT